MKYNIVDVDSRGEEHLTLKSTKKTRKKSIL